MLQIVLYEVEYGVEVWSYEVFQGTADGRYSTSIHDSAQTIEITNHAQQRHGQVTKYVVYKLFTGTPSFQPRV
jgi:hypothetical protein